MTRRAAGKFCKGSFPRSSPRSVALEHSVQGIIPLKRRPQKRSRWAVERSVSFRALTFLQSADFICDLRMCSPNLLVHLSLVNSIPPRSLSPLWNLLVNNNLLVTPMLGSRVHAYDPCAGNRHCEVNAIQASRGSLKSAGFVAPVGRLPSGARVGG